MEHYIKKYKWNFILWILASMIELAGYTLSAYVGKVMGDIVTRDIQMSLLRFTLLALPVPVLLGGAEYACGVAQGAFQKKCMISLKRDLFDKIIGQGIVNFQGDNSAKYISILNNEVRQIQDNYFFAVPYLVTRVLTLAGAAVMMFLYSPILAVVNIAVAFFPLLGPAIMGKQVDKSNQAGMEALERYNADVKDAFNGFETIKGFHAENRMVQKNDRRADEYETKMQHFRRLSGLSYYISDTLTYVSIVAGMFFSVLLVLAGYATMGEFLAMMPLSSQVMNPSREIAQFALYIRSAKPAIRRVEAVMEEAGNAEEGGADMTETLPVAFSHVKFAYEAEKMIVKDFSFEFEPGKKYAIVGSSGCGKSTLLKLLMHYYDTFEGKITLAGEDLKKIKRQSLYEHVAMIHQKAVLFEDTIRNNITMFQDYSSGQVEQAVAEAGLSDLVNASAAGLDTVIKENGQNFSGGEQQRISIARAFLRKTKLLLLDEATASLDNQTASQIDSLVLGRKDLTAIVVTHRLQEKVLREYDVILTMREGLLEEHGSFEELMAKQGFFYSLYMVNQ